jgi:hypothetical protein
MSDVQKEVRELVIARLETLPSGLGISLGADGDFSRDQMIEHVKLGDAVGKKIIEVQMNFLRSLKSGILYDAINTGN